MNLSNFNEYGFNEYGHVMKRDQKKDTFCFEVI